MGAALVPVAFIAPDVPERIAGFPYEIRRCIMRDGSVKWKATDGASPAAVVNERGVWEWEPQPGSRTDAFLARTRFNSPEEAADALRRATGVA